MASPEETPEPGRAGEIRRMVGACLAGLVVALAASLVGGGGLPEALLIVVLVMLPVGVFALATRLPDRVLGAVVAVTLAGAALPMVLPADAMGSGPIDFSTLAERKGLLAYLGVLVVFLGLALEGLRRLARWERSRGSD
ncbi:hypothetical protein J5Y09_01850 [Roseomonas sp. PWR1]|uniref:Uncharacterized protein n=1 Tax=Roseomonas nitratireducens TaxID=2820810 RepID=A0ABS4AP55_9PROT|nr:hypothetical protein [Neoroseomonas nitratireducens]MBP0462643.1 hypothetical protein [Neoroseomonas nitratireducens]